MPPLYQDPLSAVPGAEWRWLDLARALSQVSCEVWALALIALAVYSFLEDDVKGVLKAFLPLALALAAAGAVALLARALGGAPRPLEGAGHVVAPLLRRAFPTGQAAAVAVFATYTALVYGRRALPAVVAAVLVGVARALGAPHWAADLGGGALAGVLLALVAYAITLRLVPRRHAQGALLPRGGDRLAQAARRPVHRGRRRVRPDPDAREDRAQGRADRALDQGGREAEPDRGDDPEAGEREEAGREEGVAAQMRDLVLWLAQELVEKRDAVRVETIERDRSTVFELTVDPDDLGRVIGRGGRAGARCSTSSTDGAPWPSSGSGRWSARSGSRGSSGSRDRRGRSERSRRSCSGAPERWTRRG